MLTIRPFRNEDPPKLLEIWQKNRRRPERNHFFPLSRSGLDTGPLGMPFFDRHGIQLAFEDDQPVGFAHAGFGSNPNGSNLSSDVGHICLVAVVPEHPEPVAVCKELIKACEDALIEGGAHEIYGGSPRPSLPFYLGLYGGAEPTGVFDSDPFVCEAFRLLGYGIRQKTVRFQLELQNYSPPVTAGTLSWKSKIRLDVNDHPPAKSWWDALSLVQFDWIETTAYLLEKRLPVAQIRVRLSEPESGETQRLYDNNWDAALMDVRVRPEFHRQGLGAYTLGETLRYLVAQNRAARIEAHVTESFSNLYGLLRVLNWKELETGTIFSKEVL